MSGSLAPQAYFQILDDNGLIAPFSQLSFFLSGSATPAVVYHDGALAVPWTQPVVTDASARAVVYLNPATGNLKLMIADALGVPFGQTIDPYAPTNAGAASGVGSAGFIFGANSSAAITTLTYPSGATFDTLVPGSSVWVVDSATLTGTYVLEVDALMTVSGTLTVALVTLDLGSPDTPIATCAVTSLTGQVVQSAAIVFPPGGATHQLGIKALVTANAGFVIGARLVRVA